MGGSKTEPGGAADGQDPLAAAAGAAKAMRDLFNSYVIVGFSEAQAVYLTGIVLSTSIRSASQPPGGSDG